MAEWVPDMRPSLADKQVLIVGGTILAMVLIDWRLALAGLCAVPIQWNTVRWYLPRSAPYYRRERIA